MMCVVGVRVAISQFSWDQVKPLYCPLIKTTASKDSSDFSPYVIGHNFYHLKGSLAQKDLKNQCSLEKGESQGSALLLSTSMELCNCIKVYAINHRSSPRCELHSTSKATAVSHIAAIKNIGFLNFHQNFLKYLANSSECIIIHIQIAFYPKKNLLGNICFLLFNIQKYRGIKRRVRKCVWVSYSSCHP